MQISNLNLPYMKFSTGISTLLLLIVFQSTSAIGYTQKNLVIGNKFGLINDKTFDKVNRSFALSGNIKSKGFARKVGGVAFEQVAYPKESIQNERFQFHYDSTAADGQRFSISLESDPDKRYLAEIFDWQLGPIAKYADTDYSAIVSLYGREVSNLEGVYKSDIVFHEAFLDNLMGLRLFQADLMFTDTTGSLWQLPRLEGENKPILGPGEQRLAPDSSNINRYQNAFQQIQAINRSQDFQGYSTISYVLTDYNTEVAFDIVNDSILSLSGEPFYLFLSNTVDDQAYMNYIYENTQILKKSKNSKIATDENIDRIEYIYHNENYSWSKRKIEKIVDDLYFKYVEAEYYELLEEELKKIKFSSRKKSDKDLFNELEEIKQNARKLPVELLKYKIDSLYNLHLYSAYMEVLGDFYTKNKRSSKASPISVGRKPDITRKKILSALELQMLLQAKARMNQEIRRLYELYDTVVNKLEEDENVLKKMKNAEEFLDQEDDFDIYVHGCYLENMKGNNIHVFNYNPTVFHASTITMRYSALFRYYKENYPSRWAAFMQQISGLPINNDNSIQTPTKVVTK